MNRDGGHKRAKVAAWRPYDTIAREIRVMCFANAREKRIPLDTVRKWWAEAHADTED